MDLCGEHMMRVDGSGAYVLPAHNVMIPPNHPDTSIDIDHDCAVVGEPFGVDAAANVRGLLKRKDGPVGCDSAVAKRSKLSTRGVQP